MALPNPNPAGAAGGSGAAVMTSNDKTFSAMAKDQSFATDSLQVLVSLTDKLVDGQQKLFEMFSKMFERESEKRTVEDTAGAVTGEKLDLKSALEKAGGFGTILGAALAAYALDLDKYIRTAFAAPVIFKGVGAAFRSVFGGLRETKLFKDIAGFVRYWTVPLQNIAIGFKNIGKELNAFGKTVTVSFKSLNIFGKIGATLRMIVNPFVNFFNFIRGLGPVASAVGKAGALFAKVMPILKGIASKLLLPLFAIFDFISGFISGFASQGEGDTRSTMERLLDGLGSGLLKMLKGIFIVPLDLIRQGIAYVAEQLGFEGIAEALRSFSFNDLVDGVLKFARNLFAAEPEDGTFSIRKWINDTIDTAMTNAKNNLAAVGDVFSGIWKFATNLFSADPENGYFSIVKWVGDKIKSVRESITNLFSSSDTDGGGSFDLSSILPSLDFEFPSVDNILPMIGERINDLFQGMAEGINDVRFVGGTLAGFFSDAGAAAANLFGAQSIQKYNPDTGTRETMQLREATSGPAIKADGAATGQLSQDVAQKKEGGGTTVINAPSKGGDTVVQSSTTNVAKEKVAARTMNPAAGTVGR